MSYFKCDPYNQYYEYNSYTSERIKISKKEFYEKSKYNPNVIMKLKKSIYPCQHNDYILLRFPYWFPNSPIDNTVLRGKYLPCDYKLANLIKFLWKKRLVTCGLSQPKYVLNRFNHHGFITFTNDCMDKIIELFDIKNIIIIDLTKDLKLKNDIAKIKDKRNDIILENPNKITLFIYPNFFSINFLEKKLKSIHKKFGISMPKENEASEGAIIVCT